MKLSEIRAAARAGQPGYRTILKLLTSGRFNKPSSTAFDRLLPSCLALDERKAQYSIQRGRPDTIMVSVAVPGEYWEIEFFADGTLEVERFVSQGVEARPTALDEATIFDDEP